MLKTFFQSCNLLCSQVMLFIFFVHDEDAQYVQARLFSWSVQLLPFLVSSITLSFVMGAYESFQKIRWQWIQQDKTGRKHTIRANDIALLDRTAFFVMAVIAIDQSINWYIASLWFWALNSSAVDSLICLRLWPCRMFCSVECEGYASKFGAASELIAEIPELSVQHNCDPSLLELIAKLGATKQVIHITPMDAQNPAYMGLFVFHAVRIPVYL